MTSSDGELHRVLWDMATELAEQHAVANPTHHVWCHRRLWDVAFMCFDCAQTEADKARERHESRLQSS